MAVEVGFKQEVRSALAKFVEAKELQDRANALKSEAELVLREALGGDDTATVGGVVAYKLLSSQNSSVDKDTLKTEFPEIYERVLRITPYTFIKVAR